jgi:hypothetical protein
MGFVGDMAPEDRYAKAGSATSLECRTRATFSEESTDYVWETRWCRKRGVHTSFAARFNPSSLMLTRFVA